MYNIYDKLVELQEEADQEQAKIDAMNKQSIDLQIKTIDEQIKLLQQKKQKLIDSKNQGA